MRATLLLLPLVLLPLVLAACGGGDSCEKEDVCDALLEAIYDRADDCDVSAYAMCPYDPVEVGVGAGVVCGSAWSCVDKLDGGRVPCDDLGDLSLARCDLY